MASRPPPRRGVSAERSLRRPRPRRLGFTAVGLAVLFLLAGYVDWAALRSGPGAALTIGPPGGARVVTVAGRPCSPAASLRTAIWPQAVIGDGNGGVFVADWAQSAVCHVTASGQVEPVAGNGAAGFLGDGGAATAAELYLPTGLALSNDSRTLYIADRWNQRVRAVNLDTGVITTVAGDGIQGFAGDGGPATNAQLNFPTGIAVDGSGDLLIADSGNSRIREVSPDGIITTVAGAGQVGLAGGGVAALRAEIKDPTAVAVGPGDNLFITDTGTDRVLDFDRQTGTIWPVAGNGTAGSAGDGGPATSAQLSFPTGIAVDSDGNVFIADTGNQRIQRVDGRSGDISTVPGPPLDHPRGVAVLRPGELAVADTGAYDIRTVMLGAAAGMGSVIAGDGFPSYDPRPGTARLAALDHPNAVAMAPDGSLVFADGGNAVVRKIDRSGRISTVAGSGRAGFSGDGGPATQARLVFPSGVAVDRLGNVYISDSGNDRVREVHARDRVITTVLSPSAAGGLSDPTGLALDAEGNLFVADTGRDRVLEVRPGGMVSILAGTGSPGFSGDGGPAVRAQLNQPMGLALYGGWLYIVDRGNERIRRVSLGTDVIQTVLGDGRIGYSPPGTPPLFSALNHPAAVGVDRFGDILVADTGNCLIRMVTEPGTADASVSDLAGVPPETPSHPRCGHTPGPNAPSSALMDNPVGVASDGEGDTFVADSLSNSLLEITRGPPS